MNGTELLQLSRALHGARDLSEMMLCARTSCQQNTRYDRVYINVLAPDGKSFEVVGYALPNTDTFIRQVANIEVDKDPFLQELLSSTETRVIPDMRLDPVADQKHVAAFGMRTMITIPMLHGDASLGPLVIATFAEHGVVIPTDAELDFLKQVASLLAVVLARFRVEQEAKNLETKLLATQRLEALGRLAGEVAHDFNNLLLIIRGNTELAADELQGHSALHFLGMIRDATTRASALSRQLLAFSKGQVLTPRVLDMNELITRHLKMIRAVVPANIALQEILSRQEVLINADASQIEQVIMNLVLNARDAMPRGGRIVLESQIVTIDEEFIADHANVSPGRYVLLSVTDNGHGMDMETQRRVFEPFFTTKSSEKGTGLGLSVVQGIISQHHGHVHVYSEVGMGTTFKIYLPLSEQRAPDVGDKLPPRATDLIGKESVLVVDDQDNVRATVTAVLSRAGYQVKTASSAELALQVLANNPIDLLITDIIMPGTDGLSLAEAASKTHPQLQILLMTGYAPNHFREVQWTHITKPFTPTELLVQVKALLKTTT
ncbi:MAG TPA: ATP-binding protein [Steroidobacteraceae bacterium]|nr:ATP-binding protein [Steroidobacteraceae bacterium]